MPPVRPTSSRHLDLEHHGILTDSAVFVKPWGRAPDGVADGTGRPIVVRGLPAVFVDMAFDIRYSVGRQIIDLKDLTARTAGGAPFFGAATIPHLTSAATDLVLTAVHDAGLVPVRDHFAHERLPGDANSDLLFVAARAVARPDIGELFVLADEIDLRTIGQWAAEAKKRFTAIRFCGQTLERHIPGAHVLYLPHPALAANENGGAA